MKSISFTTTKKLIFGLGAVSQLSDVIKELDINSILVVTGHYSASSGFVNKILDPIADSGIPYSVFSDISPNPSIEEAVKCFNALKECKAEAVVGFGGGSAVDAAKAAALLCNNPFPISQYFGVEMVKKPILPTIVVPTTSGTGTEVSSGLVLKDEDAHTKHGVISHYLIPEVAIVDPELTLSLNPRLTAGSGMDAFTHAFEGLLSIKANPITEMYQREAIKLIGQSLRIAVEDGSNLQARYNMSLAATTAGIGMVSAGCGPVHAMAYPMEGKYNVSHGDANASLLSAYTKEVASASFERISEIGVLLGVDLDNLSLKDSASKVAMAIDELCKDVGVPKLRDIGVQEEDLEGFAEIAINNRRLMDSCPVDLSMEMIKKIYHESF